MKKKKKKNNLFLILLILLIIVGILFFLPKNNKKENANTKENQDILRTLGYKDAAIDIILQLKKEQVEKLLNEERLDYVEKLVLHSDFQLENFDLYLDYYKEDFTIDEVIRHVNNTTVSSKDDSVTSSFKQAKYYIADYLDRYLDYKNANPTFSVDTVIRYVNSNLDFAYYTNVANTDLSKGNLVIVNKYYQLDASYQPGNLTCIPSNYGGNGKYIQDIAIESYKEMYEAAAKEGLALTVSSAYRSYSYQQGLYNNYVSQDGLEAAETYSARPGHSEHQTGLAIDFCTSRCNNLGDFEGTPEFYWMKENSYKYGWILRYTEDNVLITGYMYEPWHYRYVGKEAAKIIHDNNLTFEEYYAYYVK